MEYELLRLFSNKCCIFLVNFLIKATFEHLRLRRLFHFLFRIAAFMEGQRLKEEIRYQQKCLINGICGTFDIKSNYFGPVIRKKLKRF